MNANKQYSVGQVEGDSTNGMVEMFSSDSHINVVFENGVASIVAGEGVGPEEGTPEFAAVVKQAKTWFANFAFQTI